MKKLLNKILNQLPIIEKLNGFKTLIGYVLQHEAIVASVVPAPYIPLVVEFGKFFMGLGLLGKAVK